MDLQKHITNHLNELRLSGFTIIKPTQQYLDDVLVARDQVQQFIADHQTVFCKHRDQDGHYPRLVNLHLAVSALRTLFSRNSISIGVQDGFFGAESSVYTSLYYERGSAQPLHRDSPYFCTVPELKYLGVWVALERADRENGCLSVIRGSHLVPELDRQQLALSKFSALDDVPSASDDLWNDYQQSVFGQCLNLGLEQEQIVVSTGDTVIWHPQLVHGGSAIKDFRRTRHSLVMHVTPVGVPVYQMDVFFNPSKKVSGAPSWGYLEYDRRKFVAHGIIDIGHREQVPIEKFRNV
jgi:phytanoyl-CoA hydroxylase